MGPVAIRNIRTNTFGRIWPLFQTVIQAGDTYALSPDTTMEEARVLVPGI